MINQNEKQSIPKLGLNYEELKELKKKDLTDEEINNGIAKALQQANDEIILERRIKLIELFNQQMDTLASRDCPQNIINMLKYKFDEVLYQTIKLGKIDSNRIAFIPVIPIAYLGIYGLISMINTKDGKGKVSFVNDWSDPFFYPAGLLTPKIPYFIIGVNNGKDALKIKHKDCYSYFGEDKKRSPLTVTEYFAYCIHYPKKVSSHPMICLSSHYNYGKYYPEIIYYKKKNSIVMKLIQVNHFGPEDEKFKSFCPSCLLRV